MCSVDLYGYIFGCWGGFFIVFCYWDGEWLDRVVYVSRMVGDLECEIELYDVVVGILSVEFI